MSGVSPKQKNGSKVVSKQNYWEKPEDKKLLDKL
jgi:hypothetical protein